ncbi:MAG: DUF2062 domain-containing protein [Candidatus Methylomirabilia bacterium]
MDTAPARLLIAIPVYNHGRTLRDVARRALAVHPDVLVVDDGSTDGGAATLEGLPVRLLRHERNLGKGQAILTAAREAHRLGMTHLATIDSDGQHDPADLRNFLPLLRGEPEALVIGARRFGADVPGSSRFGRSFSNFWLRVQTGVSLVDTLSGFRVYPVAVLLELPLRESGFSFENEVLVRAAWAKVPLREVEVSVIYPSDRVSHFHKLYDNAVISLLNTRLTMRTMLPWPHHTLASGVRPPGVSALHPLRALRILLSENTTPRELALAGALGVFLGTLPLIGIHTIVILIAAGFLRLNRIAAITASQITIPPFVPALAIEVGHFMRYGKFLTEFSLKTIGSEGLDRLWEWFLGSLLLGPLLGLITGLITYVAAYLLQRRSDG